MVVEQLIALNCKLSFCTTLIQIQWLFLKIEPRFRGAQNFQKLLCCKYLDTNNHITVPYCILKFHLEPSYFGTVIFTALSFILYLLQKVLVPRPKHINCWLFFAGKSSSACSSHKGNLGSCYQPTIALLRSSIKILLKSTIRNWRRTTVDNQI